MAFRLKIGPEMHGFMRLNFLTFWDPEAWAQSSINTNVIGLGMGSHMGNLPELTITNWHRPVLLIEVN